MVRRRKKQEEKMLPWFRKIEWKSATITDLTPIIKKKVGLHVRDKEGLTALHEAACNSPFPEVIDMLICSWGRYTGKRGQV